MTNVNYEYANSIYTNAIAEGFDGLHIPAWCFWIIAIAAIFLIIYLLRKYKSLII